MIPAGVGGTPLAVPLGAHAAVQPRGAKRPRPRSGGRPASAPQVCQAGHSLLVVPRDVAAGRVVHHGLPPPHQAVEQGRLADVGTADDGHLGMAGLGGAA